MVLAYQPIGRLTCFFLHVAKHQKHAMMFPAMVPTLAEPSRIVRCGKILGESAPPGARIGDSLDFLPGCLQPWRASCRVFAASTVYRGW